MEFDFDVCRVLPHPITLLHPQELNRISQDGQLSLREIIDTMGRLSARAQGLPSIITTQEKFLSSTDQRLYLMRDNDNPARVSGLLKIGEKDLYLHDCDGNWTEKLRPLCVLDFYVHESQQRRGLGLELFLFMLKDMAPNESPFNPDRFAYDRPSPKLLQFLKKHFALHPPIPQNNNFVVFSEFFNANRDLAKGPRRFNYGTVSASKPLPTKVRDSPPRDFFVQSVEKMTIARDNGSATRCNWMPAYSRHEYTSQDRSSRKAVPPLFEWKVPSTTKSSLTLKPPYACHDDVGSDWRSAVNKRHQRTALW